MASSLLFEVLVYREWIFLIVERCYLCVFNLCSFCRLELLHHLTLPKYDMECLCSVLLLFTEVISNRRVLLLLVQLIRIIRLCYQSDVLVGWILNE
jgi:hypothetical protein